MYKLLFPFLYCLFNQGKIYGYIEEMPTYEA